MRSILIFGALLVACGTAEKDDTSAVDFSEPTAEPTSSPSEPAVSETSCSDLSAQECFQCFAEENMTGYNAYIGAVIENCYCGTECGTDCADFCATPDGSVQPSATCETCVGTVGNDQTSQCIQGFSADCQGDANCVAFANDVSTCPQ